MEIYLVGGAVRDKLLGLTCRERDYVVVGSSPEAMMALGFTPVGKDFPVFLHPQTREEYALARTETKIARGYRGFSFHADPSVTLIEDLSRRDLTINAIAETADGQLIDPYGGQADLKARILRHVSPAFVEDPVRVLRLARFAARFKAQDFTIAPETMELATALHRAGELEALVPERVWQECQKALIEAHPEEFFLTLKNCGGLNSLFPELAALFGIPSQLSPTHFVDSGMHALLSLHHACHLSPEPEIRFAALCHSVGKACLPPTSWPELSTYPDTAVEPLHHLADRYKLAQRYRDIALLTAKYHRLIQNAKQLSPTDLLDLLAHTDAIRRPDRFQAVILAAEAGLIQNQQPLDLVDFFQPLIDAVRNAKPKHTPSQQNVAALKKAMYSARLTALSRAVKAFHQSHPPFK